MFWRPKVVVNDLYLITYCTAFAPLVGDDQRNYLVISLAVLSPILLLLRLKTARVVLKVFLFVLYLLVINVINLENVKWSSFFYTAAFASSFAILASYHENHPNWVHHLYDLSFYIIVTYVVVGFLQLLMISIDMVPINAIVYEGLFRQNILSVEPSHSALTICMLYMFHRHLGQVLGLAGAYYRREFIAFFFTLFVVVLTGSSMGLLAIFLIIIFTRFIAAVLFVIIGLIISSVSILEFAQFGRLYWFINSLNTLDIYEIALADHSGSIRIQPLLIYFQDINFNSIKFWIGSGSASTFDFLYAKVIGAPDEWGAGFLPGLLIDYGIIGLAVFFILVFPIRIAYVSPLFFSFFMIFMTTHWFNSQIFWLYLYMSYIMVMVSNARINGNLDLSSSQHQHVRMRTSRYR